ncbi:hypothetical protein D1007_25152 [Hordeum vulgare]|nr:hypothetical protein D1007_25152 [Hordeum vulgare]
MDKADKYATADSAMRVKVTASDKAVPTPATPKPAGDDRGGQNNNKRKADRMDSRSNNKLVASVEGETSAPQAGPPRKRSNRNNANWLPKQSFEQLLDAPCKIHSGAQPSNHTLRQCTFACQLPQGDGLPAPPGPCRLQRARLRSTRHQGDSRQLQASGQAGSSTPALRHPATGPHHQRACDMEPSHRLAQGVQAGPQAHSDPLHAPARGSIYHLPSHAALLTAHLDDRVGCALGRREEA